MEASRNTSALKRLRGTVLGTARHQTRHLVLGDHQLLAAPFGELDVSWNADGRGFLIRIELFQ